MLICYRLSDLAGGYLSFMNVVPKSSVPGIVWPAIADVEAAQAMSLLSQLQESEWWPPADIVNAQLGQLSTLLNHALTTSPFYKQHYGRHGFKPNVQLTEAQWLKTPVVTRAELQQAGDGLISTHAAANVLEGGAEVAGIDGGTFIVHATQITQYLSCAYTLRDHLWHQRDMAADLCIIADEADVLFDAESADWGIFAELLYGAAEPYFLASHTPAEEQLQWLKTRSPAYVLTSPDNLEVLISALDMGDIELSSLKQVWTQGGAVTPELRARVQQAFGVPLIDHYRCQALGAMALQCPAHDHYHIQSENVLLEVLDEQGHRCKPGETGRVVVTSLNNYVTPLIRFELGDYAQVGEPCACGRGLPVLNQIFSRNDD